LLPGLLEPLARNLVPVRADTYPPVVQYAELGPDVEHDSVEGELVPLLFVVNVPGEFRFSRFRVVSDPVRPDRPVPEPNFDVPLGERDPGVLIVGYRVRGEGDGTSQRKSFLEHRCNLRKRSSAFGLHRAHPRGKNDQYRCAGEESGLSRSPEIHPTLPPRKR
jgi:hypothetical protein